LKTLYIESPVIYPVNNLGLEDETEDTDEAHRKKRGKGKGKGKGNEKGDEKLKGMEIEPVAWETLKERVVTLPSGNYRNPYTDRSDHGWKKSGTGFIEEARQISKLNVAKFFVQELTIL
jgi:hypothetical protein